MRLRIKRLNLSGVEYDSEEGVNFGDVVNAVDKGVSLGTSLYPIIALIIDKLRKFQKKPKAEEDQE